MTGEGLAEGTTAQVLARTTEAAIALTLGLATEVAIVVQAIVQVQAPGIEVQTVAEAAVAIALAIVPSHQAQTPATKAALSVDLLPAAPAPAKAVREVLRA